MSHLLGNGGVDTAAKTTVRGDGDNHVLEVLVVSVSGYRDLRHLRLNQRRMAAALELLPACRVRADKTNPVLCLSRLPRRLCIASISWQCCAWGRHASSCFG